LVAILILSAMLRIAVLSLEGVIEYESRTLTIAQSVAAGEGMVYCNLYFPFCGPDNQQTAVSGPVPVLIFSAAISIFGDSTTLAIILLQLALGLGTTALTYVLARSVFKNNRGALLASLICGTYLHLVRLELYPQEETIFAALATLGILAFVHSMKDAKISLALVAGVVLGLGGLSRAAMLYLPPFLAIAELVLGSGKLPRRAGIAAVLLCAFGLTLSPWVLRNQSTFGSFIAGTTLTGYNLYRHNHIIAGDDYLRYVRGPEGRDAFAALIEARSDLRGDENEAEMDRVYRQEALKIIGENPGRYLILSLYRALPLYTDFGINPDPDPLPLFWQAVALENLLLLGLAIITGLRRKLLEPRVLFPLLLLVAYYTAGHMLANAKMRYAVPIMPTIIVLASDSLRALLDRIFASATNQSSPDDASCLARDESTNANPITNRLT
jgi:4-amino-4-deoxy-L-arabinose transferase-like glycosyltransferase